MDISVFEIFQIIEALGIIVFSLVSTYYGLRVLYIHVLSHGKLLGCCWLTITQTFSQLTFFIVFVYLLWSLVFLETNIIEPYSIGAVFIRPIILINNASVAVYMKIRYINEKNKGNTEEAKNG